MPVVKHGFLFKYFDKVVCGVVALAVLLAVGYAAVRSSSDADPAVVRQSLDRIRQGYQRAPEPVPFPEKPFDRVDDTKDLSPPQAVSEKAFWPPFATVHPQVTVGRYKEFELDFGTPVAVDTVRISNAEEGGSELVALLEHPVDGDYSKVLLESFEDEGTATVSATAGDGSEHRFDVVVDRNAGKTAYPPDVEVTSKEGEIEVKIVQNRRNAEDEVEVVSYEVWRREWANPLGSFELVANVRAEDIAPSTAAARRPTIGPAAPYAGGRSASGGEQVAAGLVWSDNRVEAGESYSYKVRTVGSNTFPARSDFSDVVLVEASPGVDFRWTSSTLLDVRCDVVKSEGDQVVQATFTARPGDEIGGVSSEAGMGDVNYKTGFFLVDFHRQIILPGVGVTDRMVYADTAGNLHERRRGETETGLWDMVGQTGRRRQPFGMPTGPMGARPSGFGGRRP
jgi:hypothetical protein